MLHRPSLGVSGKVGIMAYDNNEQLTDWEHNKDWSVGIGLNWNIFDGLSTVSKAHQFDSDARTVGLTERQAEKYARIEIETAFHERDASDSAFAAAQDAWSAASEALELMTQDFRTGKGQVMDLLQAEEGLRNAELGLVASRYQLIRSRAALHISLGLDLMKQESP